MRVIVKFKGFDKIPTLLLKGSIDGSNAASFKMTSHIQNKHLMGGTSSTRLRSRSGFLRSKTRPILAIQSGDKVESGTFIDAPYASTHVGPKGKKTTIRPKKSRWLTIPLPAALTSAGVMRKRDARSYGDLQFIPLRSGSPILAKVDSASGTITPLFVLKRQVEIPTRVHPEEIEEAITPLLVKTIDDHIQRSFKNA